MARIENPCHKEGWNLPGTGVRYKEEPTVLMRIIPYAILAVVVPIAGCVLKPADADKQNDALDATAGRYGYATDDRTRTRTTDDLPPEPAWRDVLRRAFLANGDLEAAYHEWAMAVHKINQAGSWPSQPVELNFEYMFSAQRMKSFDRLTTSVRLMDATALPNKTYQDAVVVWREAQAAGERFRAAKFDLQVKVLQAWSDYCLQAERVRIQQQNAGLLRLVADTAASRVRAGGSQQEQLRADVELKLADSELATMKSELEQQRAVLNGLLRRPAAAALLAPTTFPAARPIPADDDSLLAAGVVNNAELSAMGYDRESRRAAVRRARLEYMPEINPMAAFTGSISQSIGAAIVLPTQFPKIRAMIAESRADLRRIEASAGQLQADRAGQFASTLLALRDAERRGLVFTEDIIPLAQRTVDLSRQAYSNGASSYIDLIDTQRTLLEVRLTAVEARATREKMLAELEALAGMDVETLAPASPATQETKP